MPLDQLKELLKIEACQASSPQPVYEPLADQLQGYQALFA